MDTVITVVLSFVVGAIGFGIGATVVWLWTRRGVSHYDTALDLFRCTSKND